MDINIQVNIPAMELLANSVNRLADALTNGASEHLAGEMDAAIEKSMPEPQTAAAPAAPTTPAPAAPVNPTPAPAATRTAPVSTGTTPVTPAAPVQTNPAPVTPAPTAPVSAPTYTRDQLSKAIVDHLMPDRVQEAIDLMAKFGATSILDLPEERFGEFATALRNMGAVI